MSDLPSFWSGYEASCRDYDQYWRLVDETLYTLCRAHPGHANIGEVTAKVAIIGRTYSSGIERQVLGESSQAGALQRIAAHMHANEPLIDAQLDMLSNVREPLDAEGFRLVVGAHDRLVRILQEVTRKRTSHPSEGRSPRSFASKYLHFHHPAVPIYDTYAVAALQRAFAHQVVPASIKVEAADAEYEWLMARFSRLYHEGVTAGIGITVRLLDYYLLWMGSTT